MVMESFAAHFLEYLRRAWLAALLLPAILPAAALAADGSTAFCLFPLPAENGTQRYVNLTIVQYVEVTKDELRITYGGGNLGSGFDARIPVKSRAEAEALLARMNRTASACMHPAASVAPNPMEPK